MRSGSPQGSNLGSIPFFITTHEGTSSLFLEAFIEATAARHRVSERG